MPRAAKDRKEKKTFSLSPDSITFLNAVAKNYRSVSEALDHLIKERKLEAEKQRVSAGIRNYYDALSDSEREENRLWGQFAESQFPKG
jgi:hypothetical protein